MKDYFNFSNKIAKKPPVQTQSLTAFRQTSMIDACKQRFAENSGEIWNLELKLGAGQD